MYYCNECDIPMVKERIPYSNQEILCCTNCDNKVTELLLAAARKPEHIGINWKNVGDNNGH